jgi:hypothetical protein
MPLREECRLRVLRKCWGYLDLREGIYQESEENSIIKSFIICTLELNQAGRNKLGI